MEYFRDHPPACMAPYSSTLDGEVATFLSSYLKYTGVVGFGLKCTCGNRALGLKGVRLTGTDNLSGSVSIVCEVCSNEGVIFDPTKHGYDGELGQYGVSFDGDPIGPYHCKSCLGHEFSAGVLLTVARREDDLPDQHSLMHMEDFFYSFAIISVCTACGRASWAYETECS